MGKKLNAKESGTKDLSHRLEEMICNAACFQKIAHSVHRASHENGEHFGPVYQVNDAFSVELMLKAVLQYVNGETPTRTHRLKDLYNLLPADAKTEIAAIMRKVEGAAENEIEIILEQSGDAFELFRYVHEEEGGDKLGFNPMSPFFGVLVEFMRRRAPDVLERGLRCEGLSTQWDFRVPQVPSGWPDDVITQPSKRRQ